MPSLRIAAIGVCLGLAGASPTWAASAPAAAGRVEPAATRALADMSRYLQSLNSFELKTQTSLDVVTNDEQKVQLDGTATYKVRKPDAFVIDVVSDTWTRRLIYNGRDFTLYAPTRGYYATVPAPSTIRATISEIESKFGVSIPLDDLFRWGDGDNRAEALQSAFLVGVETVDGVKTDHYAFREGEIDWQVWIQQGAQPLPRKMVIVDRRDPARPGYTARLNWTLNPTFTADDFAFRPDQNAKRIRITLQEGTP